MNTSKLIRAFFFMVVMNLVALPKSALAAKPFCGDGVCKGKETETSCPGDCTGGGGGDGGGGAKPLCVMFRDDDNDTFRSDDDEDHIYCDGIELVETQIDKFRFGLNVGLNGARNFVLDLINTDCIDLCDEASLFSGLTKGWNVFSISEDGAQFLKMTDGDNKLVYFQLDFFDAEDRNWRIQFNPSVCPGDLGNMNMATAEKISLDTWEFEAGAVACLQLLEGGKKHWSFHGLYNMPFKIWAVLQ